MSDKEYTLLLIQEGMDHFLVNLDMQGESQVDIQFSPDISEVIGSPNRSAVEELSNDIEEGLGKVTKVIDLGKYVDGRIWYTIKMIKEDTETFYLTDVEAILEGKENAVPHFSENQSDAYRFKNLVDAKYFKKKLKDRLPYFDFYILKTKGEEVPAE